MATKTIAWATGSGNITLTYTGQGNGSISVSSDENDSFDERQQSINIVTTNGSPEQAVSVLVKQRGKSYPVGHVFNFDYTGSVQQVTLPKGRYKLQCWGAQGGNVTGTYAVEGSKGGYSEGVITISETTTFYIFVGGQGTAYTSSASQTSTTTVNGGWNGGGAGVSTSRYNSGDTDGRSFPRGGGGATDISTVTSDVRYSGGRTARDSASLLARCIVAGGGAGASARYTSVTTTGTTETKVSSGALSKRTSNTITVASKSYTPDSLIYRPSIGATLKKGVTYTVSVNYTVETGRFANLKAHTSNSGTAIDTLISGAYNKSGNKTITYTPTANVTRWYIEMASDYVQSSGTNFTISVTANEAEHNGSYEYYKSLGALNASTSYRLAMSGSSYNSLVVEYYNSSGTLKGTLSGTSLDRKSVV